MTNLAHARRCVRFVMLVATALLAATALAAVARAGSPQGPKVELQFLGQSIVPTGTTFAGTTVGGLSSITWDPLRNVYYSISDDPSQFQPARFYTLGLDIADGQLTNGDVHFQNVTTFLAPDGLPYAPFSLDPEGLALTKDRELVATSEGFTDRLSHRSCVATRSTATSSATCRCRRLSCRPPTIRAASGRTSRSRARRAAERQLPVHRNRERAVPGRAGGDDATGSPSRLMRYDMQTGKLDRQWVYQTDPVLEPSSVFSVNGLDELLALNNEFLIAMERSFSVGGARNRQLDQALQGRAARCDRRQRRRSIAGKTIRPAQKTLLFDLDTLGIPLDNVEGMTLGPTLPDGRRALVLVSDNNFAASQFTQFLLFALG